MEMRKLYAGLNAADKSELRAAIRAEDGKLDEGFRLFRKMNPELTEDEAKIAYFDNATEEVAENGLATGGLKNEYQIGRD